MFYPQELIDEIRIQNDIVSVISEYITLKPKGSSYFGLCPFHNESTPSFSVSADKQFYYCFGCGESGNVYGFIMKMENCDFPEAVKRLADRARIPLPEPEYSAEAARKEKLKQQIYDMHRQAGRYYYAALHSRNGEKALEYLNRRGVEPEIQKKFGIGYAPQGRDNLYKYLSSKGFDREAMVKSGLVMESKDGRGLYDRFFNRLMFPIFDIQGRAIAFGGRIIDKGEQKYLNSPETAVFSKSRTLYGMNFAKAARKREIILVEGYMDMISIYQAGFPNVVAGLGTAFNGEHAATLRKLADSVILLYDSDEAGTRAALRAIPVLVGGGFDVKVTQVTGAKDADEFIKKYGRDAFGKLIVDAVSYITFRINVAKKYYNMKPADIYLMLIPIHYKLSTELVKDMVEAPGVEEFENVVIRTTYARHYNFKQNLTMEQMYADCLHHLYTADRRKNPYSVSAINTYLFLKEEELKKLTTVMECVRYGLNPGETAAYIGGRTR